MYIVLEGIDTCGKSTQIDLLKKEYNNVVFTKEPGATDIGRKLREILLGEKNISKECEFFLFVADRAEHYQKVLKNTKSKTILSDRSFISGIAYAWANNSELDIKKAIDINLYAINYSLPDLVFMFELDIDTLQSRIEKKTQDDIEKRGLKYLMSVQKRMKDILNILDIEHININASDSIENINKTIKDNIERFL